MVKRPTLYLCILFLWIVLTVLLLPYLLTPIETTTGALHVFTIISTLFVLYFWLNGVKDVVYTLYFHIRKPQLPKPRPAPAVFPYPHVELISLAYNDFE